MKPKLLILMAGLTALAHTLPARLTAAGPSPLFGAASSDSILPTTERAGTMRMNYYSRTQMLVTSWLSGNAPGESFLGYTRQNRPVPVYYFPGTSDKHALVIGGVHGSELSAIEVVKELAALLAAGKKPYYHTVVVPCLFPDNAAAARRAKEKIGSPDNIGRYTDSFAPDPNRQMPPLGTPFRAEAPYDVQGRLIERENQMLLELIQLWQPERIANVHAIRSEGNAGVYADPRTDCMGHAHEFGTDSSLAIHMAHYIHQNGGRVLGNRIQTAPTSLYHNDPPVALPGQLQKRNSMGSNLPGNRGHGVSLGSWAATAVCPGPEGGSARAAMNLITVEFPGYRRPVDYADEALRAACEKDIRLYANALAEIFLQGQ